MRIIPSAQMKPMASNYFPKQAVRLARVRFLETTRRRRGTPKQTTDRRDQNWRTTHGWKFTRWHTRWNAKPRWYQKAPVFTIFTLFLRLAWTCWQHSHTQDTLQLLYVAGSTRRGVIDVAPYTWTSYQRILLSADWRHQLTESVVCHSCTAAPATFHTCRKLCNGDTMTC